MSSRASVSSGTSTTARLAEEYLVRGDLKEALSIYRVISESDPGNPSIKRRLGELCALADQNDAIEVIVEVARIHVGQGNTASAIAALNRAAKLDLSSDADTLIDLAGLCRRCGLSAEAERYYLTAADIYEEAGEFPKLEAACKSAAAVAPANAEVQMRLGGLCHRFGRLEDSYRSFMKAAAEFSKRGDDSAALDAYGKAVKVSLAGAEAGSALAEAMKEHGPAEQANIAERSGTRERRPKSLSLPEVMAPVEPAVPRHRLGRPDSKPESADNELVARKIATAEMVFGFGRPDRATALLKDLLDQEPNDPRIHLKLKDMYLRSRMPEDAARVYRELARIYMAQGKGELAGDCLASAQRLSGPAAEPPLQSSSTPGAVVQSQAGEPARIVLSPHRAVAPQVLTPPAADNAGTEKVIRIKTVVPAVAGRSTVKSGVRLGVARIRANEMGRRRYWLAALMVVMLGIIGGYLLIRSNPPTASVAPETALAQTEPATPAAQPAADDVGQTQAQPPESSGRAAESQGGLSVNQSRGTHDQAVQRGPQPTGDPQTATSGPSEAATSSKPSQPNPTPPAMGSIAAVPSSTGGGLNITPGALSSQVEAPVPPPTPAVRRSAVMAGGDVVRRVTPVYPLAARSAHITGTVTVDLAINEQGNVVSARATSGPGLLAGAAESAARGFKFKPMTLDGVPVKSNRTVLFHFKE